MGFEEEILARFFEAGEGSPLYVPDLTLWHEWHTSQGTLPEAWRDHSVIQIARAMGVPAWLPVFPGQVEVVGLEVSTTETREERVIRSETSVGELVARWVVGPDGDWWQTEYPVKRKEDLEGVLELVQARQYAFEPSALDAARSQVGADGVVAVEIPRRPYSDLLHEFLGWSEGLLFLREPIIEEILETLESRLQPFVEQIRALPDKLVFSPDNLDGQFISPRAFDRYLAPSYRRTADIIQQQGKRLIVHVGGPIQHLLRPLVSAGVNGLEGISGPPQSDASLAEARELVGPEPVLWGGIPQDFVQGTRDTEAFEAAVAQAAQQAQGDARVLLGVADRVPTTAELDRLNAIPGVIERANE
jgi:hypothetical protein